MIIRHVFFISLVFFLSMSPFAAGAKAISGCGAGCSMKSTMQTTHIRSGSKSQHVSQGCCSGNQRGACDFEKKRIFDLSYVATLTIRPDNHDTSGSIVTAVKELSFNHIHTQSITTSHSRALARSSPIYLMNLSFLC